eukprot:7429909-Karenia_brevis.AAC.1
MLKKLEHKRTSRVRQQRQRLQLSHICGSKKAKIQKKTNLWIKFAITLCSLLLYVYGKRLPK